MNRVVSKIVEIDGGQLRSYTGNYDFYLRARAIEVDYCDLLAHDPDQASANYLADLPVRPVLSADPARVDPVELGPPRRADARDYAVLVHRKDPPVDALYRAHAAHFATLPPHASIDRHGAGPLQINAPDEVLRNSEHLLAAQFPEPDVRRAVTARILGAAGG